MYSEREVDGDRILWRSASGASTVIPADGCLDVILHDDVVRVAGPSTRWLQTRADGDTPTIGIRFAPGAANALLGIALAELRDDDVLAADVLGRRAAARIADQLRRSARSSFIGTDALTVDVPDWVAAVRRSARLAQPVSALITELGWSERRLRRGMSATFGYGYATLVRLERARRAQALLTRGASLADAAFRAGYADQPHLTREFDRLVGITPGQFAAAAKRSIELPSGSSTVA
ncbi:helix-turn-helix transcriptional regulator [Leifsonia sp. ZF2019]|uniref:helix-turn-helix transcriptional regulator n=1 Tax=Leifsonia sp. ZF2019 TaxID=2781978 RepID=UPI001CBBFC4C|nr:helix-turn-helix transcriptional regulator [Leifsonia sp. ZF2019]UAJ79711.1 helix-turn-helix transcriptional regulator [Leifsonia sp. ZF2019]